MEKRKKEGKK